jgi:hypothetical protein
MTILYLYLIGVFAGLSTSFSSGVAQVPLTNDKHAAGTPQGNFTQRRGGGSKDKITIRFELRSVRPAKPPLCAARHRDSLMRTYQTESRVL